MLKKFEQISFVDFLNNKIIHLEKNIFSTGAFFYNGKICSCTGKRTQLQFDKA